MESLAPKAGNVHRGADFSDASVADFVLGGIAFAPAFEDLAARRISIGGSILAAVQQMNSSVNTNVYLGAILLLAPLAAAPRGDLNRHSVAEQLSALTPQDAALVYQAIRLAKPGGLGTAPQHDVNSETPMDLLEAMAAAASRDLIARQYANGFHDVFETAVPVLKQAISCSCNGLAEAIVRAHLAFLATTPDTLIVRKCGEAIAEQVSRYAADVLAAPDEESYNAALADFDFWLRADGNRRNPGATADMITAALFVLLRQDELIPPWRMWRLRT